MRQSVNINSSIPVYEQIENQVQFQVAAGTLKTGDQLPTVLNLAESLGVNPNTVAKAYRDLVVMGLISGRRGMGYFINKEVQARFKRECHSKIIERLHEVVCEAKASGMTKKDISAIASKSFASDSSPYDEVPRDVMALVRK